MGNYDAAAQEVAAGEGASSINPYDAAAQELTSGQNTQASLSVAFSADQNPDRAAWDAAVAKKFGTTPGMVNQFRDEFKRNITQQDAQELFKQFPKLQQYVAAKPGIAAYVHDDLHNMGAIESALHEASSFVKSIPAGVNAIAANLGYGTARMGAAIGDQMASNMPTHPLVKLLLDGTGSGSSLHELLTNEQAWAAVRLRDNQAAMKSFVGSDADSFVGQSVLSGAESVGHMLPGLMASVITKNPQWALMSGAADQGLQSANTALDQGKSVGRALSYGAEDAVAEYLGEKLPMDYLLKDLKAGSSFGKLLMHQMATEVPSEMATTALQDFNQWVNMNPDKPFSEYISNLGPDEAQTVISTITATLLTAGFGKGVHYMATRGQHNDDNEQAAAQQKAAIEKVNQLAQASKVLARSPETFQDFVKDASDDSPASDVYIDGNVFAQSGIADKYVEAVPEAKDQIANAIATGSTVRIPMDQYMTHIASTEYAQKLVDFVKFDPNGMTRMEAMDAFKNTPDEIIKELAGETANQERLQALMNSRDSVKQDVISQLEQNFGKDQNHEIRAEMMAAYHSTLAHRLGITPEESYNQHKLRITGEAQTGFSQSAKDVLDTIGNLREANGSDQATSATQEFIGKPLLNRDSGIQATVSKSTLRKMMSESSVKNSLSSQAHMKAVANLDHLFGIALHRESRASSKSPETIKAMHHFDVPMVFDGRVVHVKILAKEHDRAEQGTRLYDIKAVEIETPASSKGSLPHGTESASQVSVSPAGVSERFAQLADEVKRGHEFNQGRNNDNRGVFNPATNTIGLLKHADLSTFLHESGHYFLETHATVAGQLLNRAVNGEVLIEAQQKIVDDVHALFNYVGPQGDINDQLRQWETMPFEEKRSYHEKIAESFEHYLFKGEAPSIELQPYFSRFKTWLLQVYKSLKQFLSAHPDAGSLNPEVRHVFDRMLATEEEISLAQQSRSLFPLFENKEMADKFGVDYASYQTEQSAATDAAETEMNGRALKDLQWFHNAHMKAVKALQAEHRETRRDIHINVTAQVMKEPVYQAWQFLTDKSDQLNGTDEHVNGKLDADSLSEINNDGHLTDEISKLEALGMVAKDGGLHPDIAASLFGFSSGDEMVQKLATVNPPKTEINMATDKILHETYGDLRDPNTVRQAADKAVSNKLRAKVLLTETNALIAAVGKRKILADAAKEYAAHLIAVTKVRDLKPGQYATAEIRAQRESQRAFGKGNIAVAAAEKRNALLNHYLTSETYDAQDEVKRTIRYLEKFDNEGTRKNIDREYLDQIDAMLERFNLNHTSLKAVDKRASLADWIKTQEAAGIDPMISEEMRNEAFRKSYKDMTVEELRGLRDAVAQIDHIGRLKNKLLTAKSAKEWSEIKQEIIESVNKYAGDRKADTRTPATTLGKAWKSIKNFGAAHIKVATIARVLDGGKDGGPMWEYLIRPANDAGNKEATMRANATAELSKILAPVLKSGKLTGNSRFFLSVGRSLTREQRIAIALNVGNEGNLQRLIGGEGWTREQIQPILDSLTKDEWDAVQGIWDHFEVYRPEIADLENRTVGKEPAWVKYTPIYTKYGEYRGGYYPIKYDAAASMRAEQHIEGEAIKQQLQGAYTAVTTRRSFTKARAEQVNGRPLLYSLAGVYSGFNDVIHDLSWREWLIDANKMMNSTSLDSAIREHYGPEAVKQIKDWIKDNAMGDAGASNAGEIAANFVRQNVSVAALGFNIMSAAMQGLGATQSIVRIGTKAFASGVQQYISAPRKMTKEVNAKSQFMENRNRTRFRELNELRNQVQGDYAARMKTTAYLLMMRCQQMVDMPTWLGQYEKAIKEGNDEDRAIALADQSVIDSQGGGQGKDLSAVERGGAYQKLFTVFYSYMNTALQLGVNSAMTSKSKAKLVSDMTMLYVIPPLLGMLLKGALVPGDDGDDWEMVARKAIAEEISYIMGLFIVVREFGETGKLIAGAEGPRDYSGPAGVRMMGDAIKFEQQAKQGEFDDAFRKSAINLIGDLTGIPSVQINRSWTGAEAMNDGETDNPIALVAGYQKQK